MKLRTPLAAGIGLLVAAYGAYPCVTLYRLRSALAHGDTATLRELVNWRDVRQGIEADIIDQRHNTLPLFGTGFMRQIAVKTEVNPRTVVTALRSPGAERHHGSGISSAWLDGPRTLMVTADGMRLRMQLGLDGWQVTRVWLPPRVLRHAMAEG